MKKLNILSVFALISMFFLAACEKEQSEMIGNDGSSVFNKSSKENEVQKSGDYPEPTLDNIGEIHNILLAQVYDGAINKKNLTTDQEVIDEAHSILKNELIDILDLSSTEYNSAITIFEGELVYYSHSEWLDYCASSSDEVIAIASSYGGSFGDDVEFLIDSTFNRKDSALFFGELYGFQATYQGTNHEDLANMVTNVTESSYDYWSTNGLWTQNKASDEFWRIVRADGIGALTGAIGGAMAGGVGALPCAMIGAPLQSARAGLFVALGW